MNCRALHSNRSGGRRLVGERSRLQRGDVGVTVQKAVLLATEAGVVNDGDDDLRRIKV